MHVLVHLGAKVFGDTPHIFDYEGDRPNVLGSYGIFSFSQPLWQTPLLETLETFSSFAVTEPKIQKYMSTNFVFAITMLCNNFTITILTCKIGQKLYILV